MDQSVLDDSRGRFERIYRELRRRISLLDYPPGTRLSETDLAAEFGTSRTPLRRVLGRLEAEGLLLSLHGVGTMVTDPAPGELDQVFRLRVQLAELAGTLDARLPEAGEMAGFDDLRLRAAALRKFPEARAFCILNLDFFHAHLALIGNEPLREVTERLYYRTTRIWLQSVLITRIELADEAAIFEREVEDFVAALRIRDLRAAAMVNAAHISMSFTRMRKLRGAAPATDEGAR